MAGCHVNPATTRYNGPTMANFTGIFPLVFNHTLSTEEIEDLIVELKSELEDRQECGEYLAKSVETDDINYWDYKVDIAEKHIGLIQRDLVEGLGRWGYKEE